jgi:hypothetical protein
MTWRIIVGKDIEGNLEYQVSDGDVGERTESCDFKTFDEAKKCMVKLIEEQSR